MTKAEALAMLHSTFGPGELSDKIQELQPRPADFGDFSVENSELLIDWIADQLTDEDEEYDGEGDAHQP